MHIESFTIYTHIKYLLCMHRSISVWWVVYTYIHGTYSWIINILRPSQHRLAWSFIAARKAFSGWAVKFVGYLKYPRVLPENFPAKDLSLSSTLLVARKFRDSESVGVQCRDNNNVRYFKYFNVQTLFNNLFKKLHL